MLDGSWIGSVYPETSDHEGSLMIVLNMGIEDQSQSVLCRHPDDVDVEEICRGDRQWLVDPLFLADALSTFEQRPAGFSVVVIWDDGRGEFCQTPEHIASFIEAIGDRGRVISACTMEAVDIADLMLRRVRAMAFRRACIPTALDGSMYSQCQVTLSYLLGQDRFVEVLSPTTDWSIDEEAMNCDGTPLISIESNFVVREEALFERFEYVCW